MTHKQGGLAAMAVMSGLCIGPVALLQYSRLGGVETVALVTFAFPVAGALRVAFVAIALAVASLSYEKSSRAIGTSIAAVSFGVGVGLSFGAMFFAALDLGSSTTDVRETLEFGLTPYAIALLALLLAGNGMFLFRHDVKSTRSGHDSYLAIGSSILAGLSLFIGFGALRSRLGEWRYLLALGTGDMTCAGLLVYWKRMLLANGRIRTRVTRWGIMAASLGMLIVAATI